MVNHAIAVNNGIGGTSDLQITSHGSDWYWAATAIMATTTFFFIGMSFTKPRSDRIFHYITAAITMVASIAYFSMASNLGQTPIVVEFHRYYPAVAGANLGDGTREIFYVRYIDWFITTPLLLLDLLLTAGMPWPTILYTILLDEIMIVTGLVGALVRSRYKWGYYAFGCAAFLWIVYTLAVPGRKHAKALGSDIHKVYLSCGVLTLFIWFLYPVAWGLCEGGNVLHPDSEAIFYGVLDVCAKPIFGLMLIFGHQSIEASRMGLHIRDYTEEPNWNPNNPNAFKEAKYGTNGVHDSDGVHNGVSTA
ncbi:MAG: ion channel activity [Pleopsidium flavum]|nr:MAG: ion channel activity [Pleopsidium flavum]